MGIESEKTPDPQQVRLARYFLGFFYPETKEYWSIFLRSFPHPWRSLWRFPAICLTRKPASPPQTLASWLAD